MLLASTIFPLSAGAPNKSTNTSTCSTTHQTQQQQAIQTPHPNNCTCPQAQAGSLAARFVPALSLALVSIGEVMANDMWISETRFIVASFCCHNFSSTPFAFIFFAPQISSRSIDLSHRQQCPRLTKLYTFIQKSLK